MDDDEAIMKSGQEVIELAQVITRAIPEVDIGLAISALMLVMEGALRCASRGARHQCYQVIRRHLDALEKMP